MLSEITLFLKNRYNLFTLIVVQFVLFISYYTYFEMIRNILNTEILYNNSILIHISFIYYLLIFRKLFLQKHIKFLSLNIKGYRKLFFIKIASAIIWFMLTTIFVFIWLSLIFNKTIWIETVFQPKNLFYFCILSLMCSLISFAITSFTRSIWVILIILGIILFEDNFRIFLENASITKVFFKTNYKFLFTNDNYLSLFITLIYILFPLFIILKKNYKYEN